MSYSIIIYSAILYMEEIKNSSNNNNIIDEKRKENEDNKNNIFDVAIVGAGFAGLSAALLLGRYLRPTVIFDAVKTRVETVERSDQLFLLETGDTGGGEDVRRTSVKAKYIIIATGIEDVKP